jgi:hypothetical protein
MDRQVAILTMSAITRQPPPHVEVRLGRDEASKLGQAHRLVIRKTE